MFFIFNFLFIHLHTIPSIPTKINFQNLAYHKYWTKCIFTASQKHQDKQKFNVKFVPSQLVNVLVHNPRKLDFRFYLDNWPLFNCTGILCLSIALILSLGTYTFKISFSQAIDNVFEIMHVPQIFFQNIHLGRSFILYNKFFFYHPFKCRWSNA